MKAKSYVRALPLLLTLALALATVPAVSMAEDAQTDLATRVGQLEKQVEELKPAKGKGIKIGDFTFIPYGYIKVDAAYDSSRAFNGDFIAWALEPVANAASQSTSKQASSGRTRRL